MEGTLDNKSVTRQDLVDYAVNKRVREIQAEIAPAREKSNALYTEIPKITQELEKEISIFSLKHIKSTYGKMLELMSKNLGSEPIIIPAYLGSSDIKKDIPHHILDSVFHMFRVRVSEAVIIFLNNSDKDKGGGLGSRRFTEGYGDTPFINSFIRVEMKDLENPKILKLRNKSKEMEAENKRLNDFLNEKEKEIQKVRNDKDLIKDAIIEQILGQSDEGKHLLETINSIPLGQKLLG